jgi:hypothetical protein
MDLKLAPFPTRWPLPIAALPSISLIPSARFTDHADKILNTPLAKVASPFERERGRVRSAREIGISGGSNPSPQSSPLAKGRGGCMESVPQVEDALRVNC